MEGKGVRNKRPWGHLCSFVDSLRKRIRGESETAPENLTASRSLEGKDSDLPVVNMAASSSSSHEKYEVFLSFRGEDTRDGFTGHLYNALCQKHINTYKDDENLESGREISEIMEAIRESKICIIVFSQNFASSTWCLDEVVRILDCKRDGNDFIIPIFYEIEPSIVRKQNKSYAYAFTIHEELFKDSMDKVQWWRDALKEVADLSGYDSKNIRPEYKFIDKIVEDVLSKLSKYPSKYDHSKPRLIGIENSIEKIEGLLSIDSMDVHTIGLHGMGGIGKTTLARAVFQKFFHHFESHCFFGNVREEYERHGTEKLRKELLSQLFCHDKTTPILESTHFQERLRRTKVFIVLDDLDDAIFQLDNLLPQECEFGAGSRIIITSRDAQLLRSRTDIIIYEVERLNGFEALNLFHLHAFGKISVLEEYETLSESVANYACGNPLALKVLGSSLCSKSVDEWKSALDMLQIVPDRSIEKVLRISFDQLGKKGRNDYTDIQDVFLDFACWLGDGVKREFVESITQHRGSTKMISDLIDKCLIIKDGDRLSMHSLIRQMGQAIVCDESKTPGKRSRLWMAKDVCHVLERNTGSCTMEGMLLDQSKLRKDVKVRSTAFSNMDRLRFIRYFCNGFDFYNELGENLRALYNKMYLPYEGIEYLSEEVRYLQWDLYASKSLPLNFSPENLVELVMRGSQLVELPWNEGQPLGSLKKINLSYSKGLIQIQNLCAATNLEWINLEGCSSLVQVPSGFKNLKKLEDLNLGSCTKLKDGLENLPLNIVSLQLSKTAIEAFPSEFRRLSNLKFLGFNFCEKLEDIQNISSSSGISKLYLIRIAIKTLPESIWKISSLERLTLMGCPNLEKIPEISDDCMSSSLEKLEIKGCTILKSIPESIWKISSLKSLILRDCPNLEKIPEISDDCMSSSLARLDISGCTGLKSIPESILKISSLERINVQGFTISVQVPSWFKNLNKLGDLDLGRCKNLKDGLENLPLNIRRLSLDGTSIEALPSSFKRLLNLEYLNLSGCENLIDGLENLPLNLRSLYLSGCTRLKSIPVLPSDLSSLDAINCTSLETMSNWRDLQQVEGIKYIYDDFQAHYEPLIRKLEEVYPGNEIPKWFSPQIYDGNSLRIHFPPDWFSTHAVFGFIFSVVFRLHIYVPSNPISLDINFHTNVNSGDRLHGDNQIIDVSTCYGYTKIHRVEMELDHVFIMDLEIDLKKKIRASVVLCLWLYHRGFFPCGSTGN